MPPRIDCHVHLDPIGGRARPSRQPGPTDSEFATYVQRHSLDAVWGIFEDRATVERFDGVCRILPLYWVRDPEKYEIDPMAKGIKLHPYRDGWQVKPSVLSSLLSGLNPNAIVLIHCDDRSPETIEATRPALIDPLARSFPELVFVVGHSGSYAPNPAVQTRAARVGDETTRALVEEAILLAIARENVFLDTSVLVSRLKAELLAGKAPHSKLLLGTDFPIGAYRSVTDYDREEQTLAELGVSVGLLRLNAAKLSVRAGLQIELE